MARHSSWIGGATYLKLGGTIVHVPLREWPVLIAVDCQIPVASSRSLLSASKYFVHLAH